MKRFIPLVLCLIFCFLGIFISSCAEGGEDSLFIFLSVRMKGNGDGTITAVGQNEFSIGDTVLPTTLIVYFAPTYEENEDNMSEVARCESGDLNLFQKITLNLEAENGYYLAVLRYTINDKPLIVKSDAVHYSERGNRL